MVRTRRMDNGSRFTYPRRCSSRNLEQQAPRNYAGDDEDIDDEDDDYSERRHKTVVRRRRVKLDSPRDEDSLKSEENGIETRSQINKDEDDSNVEEDDVKESSKGSGGGIRRSTRKKKFMYDTLNQKWLLDGRVPEYPYFNREERSLRRGKKIIDMNEEDPEEEEEEEEEEEDVGAFEDMYTRIKRDRRKAAQRFYRSREGKKVKREKKRADGFVSDDDTADENDADEHEEEEEETVGETTSVDEEEQQQIEDGVVIPRTYFLRKKKPVTDRFQVQNEPTKMRNRCKSILHLSPSRRHLCQGSNFVTSFLSPVHRSPLMKRRLTTHNSSSASSSSCSEDERRFERQKAKSMAKARNRVLPLNLTAEDISSNLIKKNRIKIGSSLADVDPMNVDKSVTFESVGGLVKHIQGLKEMLLLPLMYPEVFEKFKITPPRGVLFYGPPGTGKTLVARALANECSQSEHKVAFFMRKGADCLSKWVGESERQLRLLFDQAYSTRPSIIFFDEIDGLAPVRSTKQDQIHSSIVSTLLALMDGLDNRGEVVVIGATNRIDAIDPALRRPGRFDREFNFSLPPRDARKSILDIHTKNWDPPLEALFVEELASRTTGYCGADLKALCAEAVFLSLRRQFPEIYTSKQKLQLDVASVKIDDEDFQKAVLSIVPAAQRSITSPARPMPSVVRPLLQNSLNCVLDALRQVFPQGFFNRDDGRVTMDADDVEMLDESWRLNNRPRLLLVGDVGQAQSTHLGPEVLHFLERFPVYKLDLPALFAVTAKSPEESCAQIFMEAQRQLPSILYLPHCSQWWETLSETVKVTFLNLIQDVEPSAPLLLLATSDCPYEKLSDELAGVFDPCHNEVFVMKNPSADERKEYFSPLILQMTTTRPQMRQNRKRRRTPLKPVPSASRAFSISELKKLEEDEEATLRELRLFLREILYKLARDRRFAIFSKPVDTSEVSDYLQVIKNPMDLETMMTKIDMHKYQTVGEFLEDIDLVATNALKYNPDRLPSDKIIRHRACTLKDFAHALINSELDLEFEKSCEEVREARKFRGVKVNCVPIPLSKPEDLLSPEGDNTDATSAQTSCLPNNNLPSSNAALVEEGAKKPKFHNGLGQVRRKKKVNSPWLVVRRRRKIVRPMKLVVYSEDSLDVMTTRETQSTEVQSLGNCDHLSLSLTTGKSESMTFFPKDKTGDNVLDVGNLTIEENLNSNQLPSTTELTSNESMMSIDSLSSNNLSSLSNTDDIGIVPNTSESKLKVEEKSEEHQSEEICTKNESDSKRIPSPKDSILNFQSEQCILEEPNEEMDETEPEFLVDYERVEKLLVELVDRTEDFDVSSLERIHSRLCRCVYRHKSEWDRTSMLNNLEHEIQLIKLAGRRSSCL